MKKTITAVVFDMDGVLFDTERIYMECWREAAEPTGLKNVDEISKACIGRTLYSPAVTIPRYSFIPDIVSRCWMH